MDIVYYLYHISDSDFTLMKINIKKLQTDFKK